MFKNIKIIFPIFILTCLLFSCTKKYRENKIVGNYRVSSYQFTDHSEENNTTYSHSEILVGSVISGSVLNNENGSINVQSYSINNVVFEYDFNEDGTWIKRWSGTKKTNQINGNGDNLISNLTSSEITTGSWSFDQLIITLNLTTLNIVTIDTNIIESQTTIFGIPTSSIDTLIEENEVIFQDGELITKYSVDELKKTEMSISNTEDSDCDNSNCINTKLEIIDLIEKE